MAGILSQSTNFTYNSCITPDPNLGRPVLLDSWSPHPDNRATANNFELQLRRYPAVNLESVRYYKSVVENMPGASNMNMPILAHVVNFMSENNITGQNFDQYLPVIKYNKLYINVIQLVPTDRKEGPNRLEQDKLSELINLYAQNWVRYYVAMGNALRTGDNISFFTEEEPIETQRDFGEYDYQEYLYGNRDEDDDEEFSDDY